MTKIHRKINLTQARCVPCEGGMPPLSIRDSQSYHVHIPEWKRKTNKKLYRTFVFKNFLSAMKFVKNVAALAEKEAHHPNFHIYYNRVQLELTTHAIQGLSKNDFILGAKINLIYNRKKP